MTEFSFEAMLDESGDTKPTDKKVRVSSIKKYAFNRDLTTPEAIEKINELRAQLEATDWQLVQPITVQKINDPNFDYLLIAGERRLTAFELGDQTEIDANIFEAGTFSEQQLRELNLVENEQREDEDLYSRALRYKSYMTDFKISSKEASEKLGIESAKFSKLTNHIVDIMSFDAVRFLYLEKGVRDVLLLTTLIQIGKKSQKSLNTIIGFCDANNCLTRKFVHDVKKHCDITSEIQLESDLNNLYLNKLPLTSTSKGGDNTPGATNEVGSASSEDDSASSEDDSAPSEDDSAPSEDDSAPSEDGSAPSEDDFDLEIQTDGDTDSINNVNIIDGHEVSNSKVKQVCVDYEGEKYNIDLSQYIPQKDGEDDYIVGIHLFTKECKVLVAKHCTVSFVSA